MKVSELIEKHGWRCLTDNDGSCSCSEAYVGGIHVRTHCWRVKCKEGHSYSCVHVWPSPDYGSESKKKPSPEIIKIAGLIARDIKESWKTDVEISFKEG